MTAEIAILNRTAVALAADSIVTLAGPKSSKTYDSAEKIFQLSRFQPIGLMIYNNALFMCGRRSNHSCWVSSASARTRSSISKA